MITWILNSIALFHLGKREGVKAYGLAWIPGFSGYVLGGIADKQNLLEGKRDYKIRSFMLVACLLEAVLLVILCVLGAAIAPALSEISDSMSITPSSDPQEILDDLSGLAAGVAAGSLSLAVLLAAVVAALSAAYTAFTWISLYKTFELTKPESVLPSIILSAIFPGLIAAIVLFVKRKYRNGVPEDMIGAA